MNSEETMFLYIESFYRKALSDAADIAMLSEWAFRAGYTFYATELYDILAGV